MSNVKPGLRYSCVNSHYSTLSMRCVMWPSCSL